MAYTNIWNDTLPTGSEAANTLDDIIRGLKVDIEQRFIDIFAMPNFTADPLRPYGLKFTDAQDAVIYLGDNAGTPRNILVKNKAGTGTYGYIGSTQWAIGSAPTGNAIFTVNPYPNAPNSTEVGVLVTSQFTSSTNITGVKISPKNALNAITNAYGLYIDSLVLTSGSTATNYYGIYINTIGAPATNNYGLYVANGAVYIATGTTFNSAVTFNSNVTASNYIINSTAYVGNTNAGIGGDGVSGHTGWLFYNVPVGAKHIFGVGGTNGMTWDGTTLDTNTINAGQSTFTVVGTTLILNNTASAAQGRVAIVGKRGSTVRWNIGFTASDNFVIQSADTTQDNFILDNSGKGTFRGGITSNGEFRVASGNWIVNESNNTNVGIQWNNQGWENWFAYIPANTTQLRIGSSTTTAVLTLGNDGSVLVGNILTSNGGFIIAGGPPNTPGSIGKYAATGLTINTISGSSYDFALDNPAGSQYIMRVPTGTLNVEIPNGGLAVGGVLTVGDRIVMGNTASSSGANPGDIVLPLTGSLRSTNVAGTGTIKLIYGGTSGGVFVTSINANNNSLWFENTAASLSASAGAASALPPTPDGYWIVNFGSGNKKIPYYN